MHLRPRRLQHYDGALCEEVHTMAKKIAASTGGAGSCWWDDHLLGSYAGDWVTRSDQAAW